MSENYEGLEKKNDSKLSLKGFFTSSNSIPPKEDIKKQNSSQDQSVSSASSHRLLLRRRGSRGSQGSISPQSSSSSISSLIRKGKSKYSKKNLQSTGQDHASDSMSHEGTSFQSSNISEYNTNGSNIDTPDSQVDTDVGSKSYHNKEGMSEHDEQTSKISNKSFSSYESHHRKKFDSDSKNKHGSHLSLKRFLRKMKHSDSEDSTLHKNQKPKSSIFHHRSSYISKKYGPIGKLLGSGATGSVNLVTAKHDPNMIFAVKKFRPRLNTESESDYKMKAKNEFKIGEQLSHENLIHTIELIKESNSKLLGETEYIIVMEYCPYDFFNLVMSGLMDKNEVFCYFKQISNGVSHLHENGLAHRDLKLDNCVVTANGILKLIDFGSAVQFRKEKTSTQVFDDDIDGNFRLVRARGVVGSDPYLSPEVLLPSNFGYDPRLADVWSIAIIFCCMILRRFPWKLPKESDSSFKSFLGSSDGGNDNASRKGITESVQDMKLDNSHESIPEKSNGPRRLLRLLPPESHSLILGMLRVETEKRYFINDVINDEFFISIEHCHHTLNNNETKFVHSKNHTHHLVTEEELQEIQMKNERLKKLKEAGVA